MSTALIAPPQTEDDFIQSVDVTRKDWVPTIVRSNSDSAPITEQEEMNSESASSSYFRVSSHGILGELNDLEREVIANNIKSLREGSEAIGMELEMDSVGYVAMYTEDATIAYRFDPESDPHNTPELVGAHLNQRVPMSGLLKDLVNSTH